MEKKGKISKRVIALEYKDAPGKNVKVAGSFNDWRPVKEMCDKNNDGTYRCRLVLYPGEYQYKFLVDGEWRSDASNPDFIPNEFGSLNSVMIVDVKK